MNNVLHPPAIERSVEESTSFTSEERAKRLLEKEKEIKSEIRNLRESVQSIQDNDNQLQVALESHSQTQRKVRERRAELKQTLEMQQLNSKIKEAREELMDVQQDLSDALSSYVEESGQLVLEGFEGQQLRIIKRYRVVK